MIKKLCSFIIFVFCFLPATCGFVFALLYGGFSAGQEFAKEFAKDLAKHISTY